MYFRRSDDLIFIYYRDLISLSKPENAFKIIFLPLICAGASSNGNALEGDKIFE